MPVKGDVTVTLRVHIDFKDFTRADMRKEPFRSHRFTRAQLRDFKWTAAEKTKFGTDFASSVATAWSKKHDLKTTTHLAYIAQQRAATAQQLANERASEEVVRVAAATPDRPRRP